MSKPILFLALVLGLAGVAAAASVGEPRTRTRTTTRTTKFGNFLTPRYTTTRTVVVLHPYRHSKTVIEPKRDDPIYFNNRIRVDDGRFRRK